VFRTTDEAEDLAFAHLQIQAVVHQVVPEAGDEALYLDHCIGVVARGRPANDGRLWRRLKDVNGAVQTFSSMKIMAKTASRTMMEKIA
jgi:hypothetical protein